MKSFYCKCIFSLMITNFTLLTFFCCSNTIGIKKKTRSIFRNKPSTLSFEEINLMIKKYDFFDRNDNKRGRGFTNQYELQTLKGDTIILDHASGLMWQDGGSLSTLSLVVNSVRYSEALKWLKELNQKGYAGYHDWRIPTLEEAMSILESEMKNKYYYIDPVFDRKQTFIWTSDISTGVAVHWVVDFHSGNYYRSPAYGEFKAYVRAARNVR